MPSRFDEALDAAIRQTPVGRLPDPIADALRGAATWGGSALGTLLRRPFAVGTAENIQPGLGRKAYQTGAELEEWAGAREREDVAAAQAAAAEQEARLRAAMGAAYEPSVGLPLSPTRPTQAPAAPAPGGGGVGVGEFVGPRLPPGGRPMPSPDAHLERLGIEPWKVDEWKAQAIGSQREGPFAVREGRGGFSQPSVPDITGMGPEEVARILRENNTPNVRRELLQQIADIDALRQQEMARQTQQAAIGATEAETELAKRRSAVLGREAMTTPQRMGEQFAAFDDIRKRALETPAAGIMVSQFMAEWDKQNPKATPAERDRQLAATEWQVAMQIAPGLRDMVQSLDPEFAMAVMRGTAMLGGGMMGGGV